MCTKCSLRANIIIKEQRVYGSLSIKLLMDLRCTLTDFERNRRASNPPNQIINKRPYSILEKPYPVIPKSTLNPWFITGFTSLIT